MWHRIPGEPFEKLVARINAGAFQINEAEPARAPKPGRTKRSKLLKLAEALGEVAALQRMLSGHSKFVQIDGSCYEAIGAGNACTVRELGTSHVYTVTDAACTCPDYKFRARICKHVEAVRRLA